MYMRPRYFGRAFDDRETRIMGDAVVMACHVIRSAHPDGETGEVSPALRRDIASTILQMAASGVMDSGAMAQAAIDRVWSAASPSA